MEQRTNQPQGTSDKEADLTPPQKAEAQDLASPSSGGMSTKQTQKEFAPGDSSEESTSRGSQSEDTGVSQSRGELRSQCVSLTWSNVDIWVPTQSLTTITSVQPQNSQSQGAPGSAPDVLIQGKQYSQIIHGSSGSLQAGQMAALIGPSGSGKTTLLNHIARNFPSADNVVVSDESTSLINGRPYSRQDFSRFGVLVGQDDILFQGSTPRELFKFAARIKMADCSIQTIDDRVEELIKNLGLEDCADTPAGGNLVSGLSGGERKRVSIGYDLITRPKVILVDEPTSGLDSDAAYKVLKLLHRQATSTGAIVLCSIHQPSSQMAELFDQVTLMSPYGRQLYRGPLGSRMREYFQSNFLVKVPSFTNPFDFLIKVAICPERIPIQHQPLIERDRELMRQELESLPEFAAESLDPFDFETASVAERITEWAKQFQELFSRIVLITFRAPIAMIALLCMSSFTCLLLASVYGGIGRKPDLGSEMLSWEEGFLKTRRDVQDILGFVAYVNQDCFAACFFSNVISNPSFLPVFKRETKANLYSVHMYYFGNWLSKLLTMGFYQLILISMLFWFLDLRDDSFASFGSFATVMALQSLNGVTVGHMWSQISDNEIRSIVSGFALMQAFGVTSGFQLNPLNRHPNHFVNFINWFSPMKYTLVMITHRVLADNPARGLVLGTLNMTTTADECVRMLLGQTVFYLLAGWLIIWYKASFKY